MLASFRPLSWLLFIDTAIFLNRPGAITNVRTWTPASGSFHGMLITHTESISIADYFTKKDASGKVTYRPTVHFAYHACDNAWMSMRQVADCEWVSRTPTAFPRAPYG